MTTSTSTPTPASASDDDVDTAAGPARAARDDQSSHDMVTSTPEEAPTPDGEAAAGGEGQPSLVAEVERFRTRWESVQIGFVDDPREAVRQADELVTQVLDDLLSGFQQQRRELEELWAGDHDASTDDLRRAFQRHRLLFDRLLSA